MPFIVCKHATECQCSTYLDIYAIPVSQYDVKCKDTIEVFTDCNTVNVKTA